MLVLAAGLLPFCCTELGASSISSLCAPSHLPAGGGPVTPLPALPLWTSYSSASKTSAIRCLPWAYGRALSSLAQAEAMQFVGMSCPAQTVHPAEPRESSRSWKGQPGASQLHWGLGGQQMSRKQGAGQSEQAAPHLPLLLPSPVPPTALDPGPALHSGILGFFYPPIAHGELEPMSGIHDSQVLLPAGLCETLCRIKLWGSDTQGQGWDPFWACETPLDLGPRKEHSVGRILGCTGRHGCSQQDWRAQGVLLAWAVVLGFSQVSPFCATWCTMVDGGAWCPVMPSLHCSLLCLLQFLCRGQFPRLLPAVAKVGGV